MERLSYSWRVFKRAILDFIDDNCLRSSAALSFYTLISIAPVIYITIAVGSIFIDSVTVRDEVTAAFREFIGEEGAEGVFVLMDTLRTEESGSLSIIFGLLLLVFSATTILVQVKNGFNEIFAVKPLEGRQGLIKQLWDRLVSMGLVLSLGFAMIISLSLDAIVVALVDLIAQRFETVSLLLLQVLQNGLALTLVFGVLYAMFRWLADVHVQRRFLLRGAALTTLILLLGKFVIAWYIGRNSLTSLGGAASSIVVLMLWVYYSSLILFFGAEIVKAQTIVSKAPYHPTKFARRVKVVEVESSTRTSNPKLISE